MSTRILLNRPGPTAGWRTWHRYLTGAIDPATGQPAEDVMDVENVKGMMQEAANRGMSAGHQDVMNKQASNWESAWHAAYGSANMSAPGAADIMESFRRGYMDGYGNAMIELDKVMPAASAQLQLLNLKEGTKIDRDLDPAAFAKWEQAQAAKIKGVSGESFAAATKLGLAALSGMAVA